MQVALSDEIGKSFRSGRILKESEGQINSIDFHRSCDLLITAGSDDKLNVYNTTEGKHLQAVPSHKYGCQNVVWTHRPDEVLFATEKAQGDEHAIRHLALSSGHGPKFVNYFRGHQARVTKLAMNPKNDTFISAAQDKEVRLWDLRGPQCQAVLQCPCQPTVAFDQQGLVFAVGLDNGVIKLYDASHYDQGPFETFNVPDLRSSPVPISQLSFSNEGKELLAVAEGKIFVLDAFTGNVLRTFTNGVVEAGAAPEASLSYDGKYVLSGCEDRAVRLWNVSTGEVVAAWHGHPGVPYSVKWAPRQLLAASACGALVLWVPGPEVVQQQLLLQQQQQQQMQIPQQPQHMLI